jgi:hypothetical protein
VITYMARALHCNVNILESVSMTMIYPDRAIKIRRPHIFDTPALSPFEIAINAIIAKLDT